MKKYQVLWLITSIIILLVISYNLRVGYYGDNSSASAFSSIILPSIAWVCFWAARNTPWLKGRLVRLPDNKASFSPSTLQRGIALFIAVCILLIQANRVGHDGFDGIAWIFGLGLAAILILFAVHGLSFVNSDNHPV